MRANALQKSGFSLGVDKIYNFASDDVADEGGQTKSDSRIKLQNC